jgi:hypothetical protein
MHARGAVGCYADGRPGGPWRRTGRTHARAGRRGLLRGWWSGGAWRRSGRTHARAGRRGLLRGWWSGPRLPKHRRRLRGPREVCAGPRVPVQITVAAQTPSARGRPRPPRVDVVRARLGGRWPSPAQQRADERRHRREHRRAEEQEGHVDAEARRVGIHAPLDRQDPAASHLVTISAAPPASKLTHRRRRHHRAR